MTESRKERVNLTFTAAELRRIKRGKPSHWGVATWVKHLALLCSSNSALLGVTRRDLAYLEVSTPTPARARDTVSSPTTSKSINAPDAGEGASAKGGAAELEALLERLDWYGAKFTAGSSPKVLAAKLVDTYPKVDHQQTAKEASAWLLAHPANRKQYVARFLVGWFKNASKPPPWEPQTQLSVDRRPLAEQIREQQEKQRASAAASQRQADEMQVRHRLEVGATGPVRPEFQTILDRVTAREDGDE